MLYKHTCDNGLNGQGDAHSGPAVHPRLRGESTGLPGACGAEQSDTVMVSKSVVCCGRERQNGSYPVDRGRAERVKAVRSELRWVA